MHFTLNIASTETGLDPQKECYKEVVVYLNDNTFNETNYEMDI